MPIKWMAIESIRDRIFSLESDVWSFGVMLWELFSLSQTPYPSTTTEQLLHKLEEGYRMDAPHFSNKYMYVANTNLTVITCCVGNTWLCTRYQIMLDCWKENPLGRPTFVKLIDRIGSLLQGSIVQVNKMHATSFLNEYFIVDLLSTDSQIQLTAAVSKLSTGVGMF